MYEKLEFYNEEITEFYPYRSARCMHSIYRVFSKSKTRLAKIFRPKNG